MKVSGKDIPDETLAELTDFIRPFAEAMTEKPTEFELVSCIGFEYFVRQKCDIVVLEVGMGGAFDATNVIDCPEVTVLTAMGIKPQVAEWALRFSLSPHTTEEEIDYAAGRIGTAYDLLKRFQRR